MLSSCMGTVGAPVATPMAQYDAKPKASPAKTVTNFSESLGCMDDLFNKNGIAPVFISSQDIQDKATPGRKLGNGGTDMLISAVSEIATSSGAVRYVGYKSSIPDLAMLHGKHKDKDLIVPDYYIVGSISQLDDRIQRDRKGLAVGWTDGDIGLSADRVVSVLGLDLNIFEVKNNLLMPGVTAKNSLAVIRDGKDGDIGGRIRKTGISFNISLDKNEGKHQAIRTLIELSVVEVMGKLTGVPYWDCLGLDATNNELKMSTRRWWKKLGYEKRIAEVQTAMQVSGLFSGDVTGMMDDETIASIKSFQRTGNMVIDGKVSLDLFLRVKSAEASTTTTTTIESYMDEEALVEVEEVETELSEAQLRSSREWLEG